MEQKKDVIIFDGICKMCNAFFKWVHKNDKKDIFMFTNFQSDYTSNKMDILKDSNSIAVILADGTVLRKINAIKHVLKETKKFIIITLILKILPNFISACFKFLYYLLTFNSHKKKIAKMRICGIYSSVLGKKSSFRIEN